MNRQLTKKTIGIAASAALIASVAFTSNAVAAPGGNPKASIGVDTWCEIKAEDEAAGNMTVHIKIEDKSSGVAYGNAILQSAVVVAASKDKGNSFDTEIANENVTADVAIDNTYYPIKINLCGGADLGKAINAETTVTLTGVPYPSSKGNYTAQCGNAPGPDAMLGTDDDVILGGLKTADYPGLCSAP